MPTLAATDLRPRRLVIEHLSIQIEGRTLEDVQLGGWVYGPELGTAPAERDRILDRVLGALELRLDPAVGQVADPAGEPEAPGGPPDAVPEEHALDPPRDGDVRA